MVRRGGGENVICEEERVEEGEGGRKKKVGTSTLVSARTQLKLVWVNGHLRSPSHSLGPCKNMIIPKVHLG